jgi:transcriptional regulator with XRE-family HTH domain
MPATITPQQCRSARALLNITQEQLSDACAVPIRTIAMFESGGTTRPRPPTFTALIRGFSRLGIVFLNADEAEGVLLVQRLQR